MAYNHKNLALCLGLEFNDAPGIETKDGCLIAFPEDLGPMPSDEQLQAIVEKQLPYIQYKENRLAEYPSFGEQFDLIYHGGLDAWKQVITAVKEKYPKP